MDSQARFDRLIAEGLQASREQRTEAAFARFEEASKLMPASGVPHFLIGSQHAAAGDVEAAEASFARAVLLAPDFALARYQLGLLQFSSQRASLALLTWQPLMRLPAVDPLRHFVRGFEALARDSFDEALQRFRQGLGCPDVSDPLAGDILQVVAAIVALSVTSGAAAGDARAQPNGASQHVLLAGYAQRLH